MFKIRILSREDISQDKEVSLETTERVTNYNINPEDIFVKFPKPIDKTQQAKQ